MPIDYTKIKRKINGQIDPFPVDQLTLRVGVVSAINSNGTADVVISGVTVPNVSRLAEATIAVDAVVQLLSYRGSLLIIGRVASSAQTAGLGLWARGRSATAQTGIGTTLTGVLTTNTVTFVKNRVYECRTHGGLQLGSTGWGELRPFRSGGAQLGEWYRFPLNTANVVMNGTGSGIYFTAAANVSGAVQLQASFSVAGGQHYASASQERNIEVWDVGDISQFPGVPTW